MVRSVAGRPPRRDILLTDTVHSSVAFLHIDQGRPGFDDGMGAVIRDDPRSPYYLIALGAVGAVTAAVLFGVAFLWLVPPHPAAPPADPVPPSQPLETDGGPQQGVNDMAPAPTPRTPTAASPTPAAPSNQEAATLGSAPIQTALIPPAGITRTQKVRAAPHPHKRVTISRLQHGEARGSATPGVQQTPEGQGAALWRSDASARPNAQIQSDGSAYPREDRPESGIEPIGGEPSG